MPPEVLSYLQMAKAETHAGHTQVAFGSPLDDLVGIMHLTENAMLAVTPCDRNPDAYYAAAAGPHRQVPDNCIRT